MRIAFSLTSSTAEANGDDVAGVQLALVFDALLNGGHAATFAAQPGRGEADGRESRHDASSNLPTYHITFMWPMWSH